MAALVLACAAATFAQAQPQPRPGAEPAGPIDPSVPIRVERAAGAMPIFVLGANRFTPRQIAHFLTGLPAFLRRARGVPPGQQLAWRVEGLGGYLSLSTSPFAGGPDYLLTLRAEPVRSFDDEGALLQVMERLGRAVLRETDGLVDPGLPLGDPPPPGAPRLAP